MRCMTWVGSIGGICEPSELLIRCSIVPIHYGRNIRIIMHLGRLRSRLFLFLPSKTRSVSEPRSGYSAFFFGMSCSK